MLAVGYIGNSEGQWGEIMNEERLQSILEKALKAERDGFALYSMAAERAEDPGAREMFERLAQDEKHHHETLQKQYMSLHGGKGWRMDLPLEMLGDDLDLSEVFSAGFRERIQGKHVEASALSIGLLLERNAIAFYSKLAEEAETDALKAFFRQLADWEDTHFQLLLRLDEDLKEDYWTKNRFAPLL